MAGYSIFCYLVVLPLCFASVIRNGVNLVALPVPGHKNSSIVVNTRSEKSDVGVDQVQQADTVTVKTPVATLTFANVEQHPKQKSLVEQMKNGLTDDVLAHLDPTELIDLDLPVQINDLLQLAQSSSPAKFREMIYGSQLMEKLIDTLQQKSVELYRLKNELEDSSHEVEKREAIWSEAEDESSVEMTNSTFYDADQRWSILDMENGRWRFEPDIEDNPKASALPKSMETRRVLIHHLHPHLPPVIHRAHLPHTHQPHAYQPHLPHLPHLPHPHLPHLPHLPHPHLPHLFHLPHLPHQLHLPHLPHLPQVHPPHTHLPHLPQVHPPHTHLPHLPHLPVLRLPHLHLLPLLPLLRTQALPLLQIPQNFLHSIMIRPTHPLVFRPHSPFMSVTYSPVDSLAQPLSDGLRKLKHRILPQTQMPYNSLAYYHQLMDPQSLPDMLPQVNSQVKCEQYEGGLQQQQDVQVDQTIASVHQNPQFGNYKPITPWQNIFFSLFRDFSLT